MKLELAHIGDSMLWDILEALPTPWCVEVEEPRRMIQCDEFIELVNFTAHAHERNPRCELHFKSGHGSVSVLRSSILRIIPGLP